MKTKSSVSLAISFLGSLLLSLGACSDKSDDKKNQVGSRSSSGFSYGEVKLSSSSLASTALLNTGAAQDCSFNMDIYQGIGSCITPLSVKGAASQATFDTAAISDPSLGSARILGANEDGDSAGKIFNGGTFDFADVNGSGIFANNTLWAIYDSRPNFDHVTVGMNYI